MQNRGEHMGLSQLLPSSKRPDGEAFWHLLIESKLTNDIQHHVRRLSSASHAIQRAMASNSENNAHDTQQDELTNLRPIPTFGIKASHLRISAQPG